MLCEGRWVTPLPGSSRVCSGAGGHSTHSRLLCPSKTEARCPGCRGGLGLPLPSGSGLTTGLFLSQVFLWDNQDQRLLFIFWNHFRLHPHSGSKPALSSPSLCPDRVSVAFHGPVQVLFGPLWPSTTPASQTNKRCFSAGQRDGAARRRCRGCGAQGRDPGSVTGLRVSRILRSSVPVCTGLRVR